jgi:hypothetical protein
VRFGNASGRRHHGRAGSQRRAANAEGHLTADDAE